MSAPFRIFGEAPMSREAFLEAPIGELEDCVLSLRCYEGCERPATCSLQLMAAHYGPNLQLRMLIKRLRCTGCKRPPAAIAISDAARAGPAQGFATWRAELMP